MRGRAVVEELVKDCASRTQLGDNWAPWKLWAEVASLKGRVEIGFVIGEILTKHGFNESDASSAEAPNTDQLLLELRALHGEAPLGGSGGFSNTAELDPSRFTNRLPNTMKRAAPEIYVSLLEGNNSARDWLNQFYQGNRRSASWIDLWNSATIVDFQVDEARRTKGPQGVTETLMKNDMVELALRRLASFVYGSRTGDWGGASYMLAVKAPGSDVDIGPNWLINEATTWSKSEHQRSERVKSSYKFQGKKGDNPKGKGKGGKPPGGGGSTTQG